MPPRRQQLAAEWIAASIAQRAESAMSQSTPATTLQQQPSTVDLTNSTTLINATCTPSTPVVRQSATTQTSRLSENVLNERLLQKMDECVADPTIATAEKQRILKFVSFFIYQWLEEAN